MNKPMDGFLDCETGAFVTLTLRHQEIKKLRQGAHRTRVPESSTERIGLFHGREVGQRWLPRDAPVPLGERKQSWLGGQS